MFNDVPTLISFIVGGATILWFAAFVVMAPRQFVLVVKNLGRNRLRTILTGLAIMVLVMMFTLIWTIIVFLDQATSEQSKNLKLIITERWQVPSMMPPTHANYLSPVLYNPDGSTRPNPDCVYKDAPGVDVGPNDFMTWSFYGGSTEQGKFDFKKIVFAFVMNPDHIRTMMDDLEDYDPRLIEEMKRTRNGVLMGKERMEGLNKKVGETFKIYSFNYKGIDLEFKIVGELPAGRYNMSAIMNDTFFNEALNDFKARTGAKHPLDDKRLNLIWLRVKDRASFDTVGKLIEDSPMFSDRPVKCETASSGIGNFLDPFRPIVMAVKFLLVPAILISMALLVSNTISISVRERRGEIAVLKVLGFRPFAILRLVLSESVLVGALSGFLAALATYVPINLAGGLPFQIVFFPFFTIPATALAWGFGLGAATSLMGSFLPAWNAQRVKVSEVFSKVA